MRRDIVRVAAMVALTLAAILSVFAILLAVGP